MRFIAVAIGAVLLGATPAWACPDASLQSASDIMFQAKAGANVAKLAGDLDAIVTACPADPFVLKVAAMGKHNLAAIAEPASRFKLRSEAWSAWRKALAARKPDQPKSKIVAGLGNTTFDDSYEVQKTMLAALLSEEGTSAKFIAEHAPFKPGDPAPRCEDDWDSIGQQVRSYVSNYGWSDAGMNFLNRAIAACEAGIADKRDRTLLAARATVLMRGVRDGKAPAGALDTAYDDATLFVANGGYMAVWWREPDDMELHNLIVSEVLAGRGTPQADWFNTANLGKRVALTTIALALDKAWSESIAAGVVASKGYKVYVDLLGTQFNRAKAHPASDAARLMLAQAAKLHAQGKIRRPENVRLEAPPVFLWNWIHPDVKP